MFISLFVIGGVPPEMVHPGRLAYLLRYYLDARFAGKKRPYLCGIKLTHRCTLRCRQCPYWRRPASDLPYEALVSLLPDLYSRGIRAVIFEGGEPYLWRDKGYTLADAAGAARGLFPFVGVTTNGTLPLDFASPYARETALPDVIWVSFDGLRDTHDSLRGPSFARIVENIRSSTHPRIFANVTINSQNVEEIPGLVWFLRGLVKGITIQFFYPYGEVEDLTVSKTAREHVLNELIKEKKEGLPVANSLSTLEALKSNSYRCEPWMIADVDPDGSFHHGCYLLNRTEDSNPCARCGFAAHAEISLAYQLRLDAIAAGRGILGVF